MMEQNRLKSPVFWSAIVAQVFSMLLLLGVVDVGISETAQQVVAGVLQLLVLFGVLNNPTDKEGF